MDILWKHQVLNCQHFKRKSNRKGKVEGRQYNLILWSCVGFCGAGGCFCHRHCCFNHISRGWWKKVGCLLFWVTNPALLIDVSLIGGTFFMGWSSWSVKWKAYMCGGGWAQAVGSVTHLFLSFNCFYFNILSQMMLYIHETLLDGSTGIRSLYLDN